MEEPGDVVGGPSTSWFDSSRFLSLPPPTTTATTTTTTTTAADNSPDPAAAPEDLFRIYEKNAARGPLFVFHHGAGHTAHTWALLIPQMQELAARSGGADVPFSFLSFDCRGHGQSSSPHHDTYTPLSQLTDDLINVIAHCRRDEAQEIVLVGHSMGGAVICEATSRNVIKNVIGVVVIDVVEGTAIESLRNMKSILLSRPTHFRSIKDAINWSLRSQQVTNRAAAEISVPAQLVPTGAGAYGWRTDLAASEPYWHGWFEGLSTKFLSARAGRLLVLAGTDRLDKELAIGQMQGKFQMEIVPDSGHCIQEDSPARLAHIIVEFWKRNRRDTVVIKRFPIPSKPHNKATAPSNTS